MTMAAEIKNRWAEQCLWMLATHCVRRYCCMLSHTRSAPCVQCVWGGNTRWEVCQVVYEWLTHQSRSHHPLSSGWHRRLWSTRQVATQSSRARARVSQPTSRAAARAALLEHSSRQRQACMERDAAARAWSSTVRRWSVSGNQHGHS
jgi:hypothetical protein